MRGLGITTISVREQYGEFKGKRWCLPLKWVANKWSKWTNWTRWTYKPQGLSSELDAINDLRHSWLVYKEIKHAKRWANRFHGALEP